MSGNRVRNVTCSFRQPPCDDCCPLERRFHPRRIPNNAFTVEFLRPYCKLVPFELPHDLAELGVVNPMSGGR